MKQQTNLFYSGTSGLVVPVTQAQYPAKYQGKSRLAYYASLFNSIEINSSFYKTPRAATVANWAESVPAHFRFTFKLSRAITHVKGLDFKKEDVAHFMHVISHAGKKKGCLLIQFPAGLRVDQFAQVKKLLKIIRKAEAGDSWKLSVEFRHTSWYHKKVYALLDLYNAALVVHDVPASATPMITQTAGFKYLRFHGVGMLYRGSYTDETLQQYASTIKTWLNEGQEVYAYFNNTIGDAFKNLQALNSLVYK